MKISKHHVRQTIHDMTLPLTVHLRHTMQYEANRTISGNEVLQADGLFYYFRQNDKKKSKRQGQTIPNVKTTYLNQGTAMARFWIKISRDNNLPCLSLQTRIGALCSHGFRVENSCIIDLKYDCLF